MWWSAVTSRVTSVVSTLPLYALVWCTLVKLSREGYPGPSYNAMVRHCRGDDDCDQMLGQACIFLYKGCHQGQCMCDPARDVQDNKGRCRRAKLGKDECTMNDKCPPDMRCMGGYCRCRAGRMTTDKLFCMQEGDRLLGYKCRPSTDRCFQRTSYRYSQQDVFCSSDGYCTCEFGFKKDHISCKRRSIGEAGCTSSYQCQGGALCNEGKCLCPPGYKSIAANTKCANINAITNLGFLETCDEMKEQRYCNTGLICQRCGEDQVNKCIKFALVAQHSYLTGNSSASTSAFSVVIHCCCGFMVFLVQAWIAR